MHRIVPIVLALLVASCAPRTPTEPPAEYQVTVEYGTPLYELVRRTDPDTQMPRDIVADEGPVRSAVVTMAIVPMRDRELLGWRQARPHELVAMVRQYGVPVRLHYRVCAFGTLVDSAHLGYDRGNFYLWNGSCRWAALVKVE